MVKRKYKSMEERCKQVYDFFVEYFQQHNIAPSTRDMLKAAGIKSTSHINKIINRLVSEGKLEREDGIARGLRLPKSLISNVYPISLEGYIAADNENPLMVYESFDSDSTVDLPAEYIPKGTKLTDLFALKIKGDSMNAALIADGDTVVIKRGNLWNDGDIVAIWLGNDEAVTLKKLYRSDYDVLKLKPDSHNPKHRARYENQSDIRVMGRLVAVMRAC